MGAAMPYDRELYPLPEARKKLGGLSHSKLYELVKKGDLRLVKIGRRSYLTREEIRRFVASLSSSAAD